jgi:hypothetical protein
VLSYSPRSGAKAKPVASTPPNMPASTARPSPRPLAAATHDVPGQRPPTARPTPNTAPPTSCGTTQVSGTYTRDRSSTPSCASQNVPSIATRIALNITLNTARSVP